ncbi:keratin, type I cytoskeletal 9 isoform X2 [Folsomia candida]|nr:keratin, type I cytoskeletal 9 isoform X2 [Folsomia candida]
MERDDKVKALRAISTLVEDLFGGSGEHVAGGYEDIDSWRNQQGNHQQGYGSYMGADSYHVPSYYGSFQQYPPNHSYLVNEGDPWSNNGGGSEMFVGGGGHAGGGMHESAGCGGHYNVAEMFSRRNDGSILGNFGGGVPNYGGYGNDIPPKRKRGGRGNGPNSKKWKERCHKCDERGHYARECPNGRGPLGGRVDMDRGQVSRRHGGPKPGGTRPRRSSPNREQRSKAYAVGRRTGSCGSVAPCSSSSSSSPPGNLLSSSRNYNHQSGSNHWASNSSNLNTSQNGNGQENISGLQMNNNPNGNDHGRLPMTEEDEDMAEVLGLQRQEQEQNSPLQNTPLHDQ